MTHSMAAQRMNELGIKVGDRVQSDDGFTGVLDDVSERVVRVLWDDGEDGENWLPDWVDYRSIDPLDKQTQS